MIAAGAIFFIFDQQQAARLAARPDFLDGIDCVISTVPGITLDGISANITCLTLEQALDLFAIRHRAISELGSQYALALLDKDTTRDAFLVLGLDECTGVRVALLNHVALLVHNAFAFELLFKALAEGGVCKVRCFAFYGRYRLLERPDIKMLLHVELGFGPHLAYLCNTQGVKFEKVAGGGRMAIMRNTLRTLLLQGYKAKALLVRSLKAKEKTTLPQYDAVFVVRAQTEVTAAVPLLRLRHGHGRQDCLLVDDLIKSPDGTHAASQTHFPFYPLHGFLSPSELAIIFLRKMVIAGRAARKAGSGSQDRLTGWGFFGQSEIACAVLRATFTTVPELAIFHRQLCRALDRLRADVLVSFDTVDRWGAVLGACARAHGVRSVMVQNTTVDDIEYPHPQSTNHLVVANDTVREIFLASNVPRTAIHALGLPVYDCLIDTATPRIERLTQRFAKNTSSNLKVLVATQPFVQEFDYNHDLLDSLRDIALHLNFGVSFLIKRHPREDPEHYRKHLAAFTNSMVPATILDGPFDQALDSADLLISRTSTSLELAALGGVPGIAYLHKYPADIIERLTYLKSPVTLKVFTKSELHGLLETFHPNARQAQYSAYTTRRSDFLSEHFPNIGHASKKVNTLINKGVTS